MNTTATLQYNSAEHSASSINRILEAPERWLPFRGERNLYSQCRYGWNHSLTYRDGHYPWIMNPITTNSCSIAFS